MDLASLKWVPVTPKGVPAFIVVRTSFLSCPWGRMFIMIVSRSFVSTWNCILKSYLLGTMSVALDIVFAGIKSGIFKYSSIAWFCAWCYRTNPQRTNCCQLSEKFLGSQRKIWFYNKICNFLTCFKFLIIIILYSTSKICLAFWIIFYWKLKII